MYKSGAIYIHIPVAGYVDDILAPITRDRIPTAILASTIMMIYK